MCICVIKLDQDQCAIKYVSKDELVHDKMQFACECVDTVVLPSLSESVDDGDSPTVVKNISKEDVTTTSAPKEDTPQPLKRKHRRSKVINSKKLNSPGYGEESTDDESSLEACVTKNTVGAVPTSDADMRNRLFNITCLQIGSDEERAVRAPSQFRTFLQGKRKHKNNEIEEWFNAVSKNIRPSKDNNATLEYLMQTTTKNAKINGLIPNKCDNDTDSSHYDDALSDVAVEDSTEAEPLQDEKNLRSIVPQNAEEVFHNFNSIDIEDKRLIVVEQNAVVYLYGAVRVRVIRGAIEVLGYVLSNNGKSANLYSPKGTSFLYIRAVSTDDELCANIDTSFCQNDEVLNFIEQQTYDSSLIICETIEKPQSNFIEKHVSQQIYPKQDSNSARYLFEENPGDSNVIKTNSDWDRVCDSIAPRSKVFLCGGKGVGKSTFLRYAINRLLMKYKEVRVVDLDPGQPEFTVPGCVSFHTITEPVFGPNYTHIKKPDRCIFLPNVNIGYNPKEYIYVVKELLSYCSSDELPTLINYMGFSLGIGLNIACSVIAEVNPTIVVQIQSHYHKKNFSRLLTPECIIENMLVPINVTPEELSYQLVVLDAMSDSCSGFAFQPRQVREMCTLAYISQMFPHGVCSLTNPAVPVYKSSLQNITLIANGAECHPAVVNGNLVALCTRKSVYNDVTIYRCHGWGVVRGIDLSTNEIFLLTPELGDTLELITHLIYGSVNIPPSVYMTADDVNGVVPYVSLGTLTSFSSIPKRTHLPKQSRNK